MRTPGMYRSFSLLVATAVLAVGAEPAACVSATAKRIHDIMADLKPGAPDKDKEVGEHITLVLSASNTFVACVAATAAVEQKRIDKQSGAASSASGSTTAVASPAVPQLLGMSLESGAVTRSVSGNSVTFRINPAKVASSIVRHGLDPWPVSDPGYRAFNRFSIAFTKDTSQSATGQSQSGTTLVDQFRQVSDVSVRVDLINHRDVFSKFGLQKLNSLSSIPGLGQASGAFRAAFQKELSDAADSVGALTEQLVKNPSLSEAEIATRIEPYFKPFQQAMIDPKAKKAANDLFNQLTVVSKEQMNVADVIAHAFIMTLDYDWKRPPQTTAQTAAAMTGSTSPPPAGSTATATPPNQHTLQLILSNRLVAKSEGTLTLGSTFFGETRPGMKGVWRDSSAGAKWAIPVGDIAGGKASINFSGLYLYLHQPPLGIDLKINDQKINKPGSIGLFQAQFKIDLGTSGVSIPVSFTTSNRTELVKEKEIRGNIGISFDLDKLLAGK